MEMLAGCEHAKCRGSVPVHGSRCIYDVCEMIEENIGADRGVDDSINCRQGWEDKGPTQLDKVYKVHALLPPPIPIAISN